MLDESVLYRRQGTPQVMAAQIGHLIDVSQCPRIDLQVLPLDPDAHVAQHGSFQVMKFPAEMVGDPGVVYLELVFEGRYYEDPEEIAWYDRAMARLRVQAASQEQSAGTLCSEPSRRRRSERAPARSTAGVSSSASRVTAPTSRRASRSPSPPTVAGGWRDTKDRTTPAHYYPSTEWDAFIRGVKKGEFG